MAEFTSAEKVNIGYENEYSTDAMTGGREWNKMVDRAMAADFSWGNSARQYEEMYNWLIGDKQKQREILKTTKEQGM